MAENRYAQWGADVVTRDDGCELLIATMPTGIVRTGLRKSMRQHRRQCLLARTGVRRHRDKLPYLPKDPLFRPGRVIVTEGDTYAGCAASALGVGCSLAKCRVELK